MEVDRFRTTLPRFFAVLWARVCPHAQFEVDRRSPNTAETIFGDGLPTIFGSNRVASFTADNETISGDNVTITASSATHTRWDDLGEYAENIAGQLLDTLNSVANTAFSLLSPVSGQIKVHQATGQISLTNTLVNAGGDVEIAAEAESMANFTTVGINARTVQAPFLVNVGIGRALAEAKAHVDLDGNTRINADGDVAVTTP
jgi:hypothetical protein